MVEKNIPTTFPQNKRSHLDLDLEEEKSCEILERERNKLFHLSFMFPFSHCPINRKKKRNQKENEVLLLNWSWRINLTLQKIDKKCAGGSVVEFSPATREARVRFPAGATFFFSSSQFNLFFVF